MTSFYFYEFPEGRTADSFEFRLDLLWVGAVIDELWTDDPDDVEWITRNAHEELYDVHVVHKDGKVDVRPVPCCGGRPTMRGDDGDDGPDSA